MKIEFLLSFPISFNNDIILFNFVISISSKLKNINLFDDNYFVSGGGDNKICVYKIEDNSFKKVYEKNAFEYDVNCVDCKKNENLIGSSSDDGIIKLWKINFE